MTSFPSLSVNPRPATKACIFFSVRSTFQKMCAKSAVGESSPLWRHEEHPKPLALLVRDNILNRGAGSTLSDSHTARLKSRCRTKIMRFLFIRWHAKRLNVTHFKWKRTNTINRKWLRALLLLTRLAWMALFQRFHQSWLTFSSTSCWNTCFCFATPQTRFGRSLNNSAHHGAEMSMSNVAHCSKWSFELLLPTSNVVFFLSKKDWLAFKKVPSVPCCCFF